MVIKFYQFFNHYLFPLVAPTHLLTDHLKHQNKIYLIPLFHYYLLTAVFLSLLLAFLPGLRKISFFRVVVIYYSFSRCLEIFFSYLTDSIDKMKYKPRLDDGLSYTHRFVAALEGYLELLLNFALIYFLLPGKTFLFFSTSTYFNQTPESILETIYFSTNTVTILGFGDIYPQHPLIQLLVSFQVLAGVLILIVTFTIYVSLNFTKNEDLNSGQKTSQQKKKTRSRGLILAQLLVVFGLLLLYVTILKTN